MSIVRRLRPSILPRNNRYNILNHSIRAYATASTNATTNASTTATDSTSDDNARAALKSTSSSPSSVSQNEVDHFSTLASSWWDPHGSSRLLHQMNPLRHQFINRCLASSGSSKSDSSSEDGSQTPARGLTYLDIGCGGGIFAESAARMQTTRQVTAIDPTPACIDVARSHARTDPRLARAMVDGKLSYLCTDIESLPALGASIPRARTTGDVVDPNPDPAVRSGADVVTLFEVLEHVQRPSRFLETCTTHVRPGGWLVGSTISRTWSSWVTTKLFAEHLLGIVPVGTHDWAKYIDAREMGNWMRELVAGTAGQWGNQRFMGVVYVPGLGWREVQGSQDWGNYFFAIQKLR